MVELLTDRLIIRQPTLDDVDGIVDYLVRNREHLSPWEPTREPAYYTAAHWMLHVGHLLAECQAGRQLDLFLFEHSAPTRVIGKLTFSAIIRGAFHACYLGYALDGQSQGRGYMTEALTAAIDYMFTELGLHRIMANYQVTNERSAAVLKRLGFEVEGTARSYLRINGAWEDHVLTARINNKWSVS
jgi:ribosomal-protein-alanine N-acetyltransferase